jgi:hypothetical protein
MRNHRTKIALAATLVTALTGAAPASAKHEPYILALATGHQLPWPTANEAQAKQNYNYHRRLLYNQGSGYQWDPWGHWGAYHGPMIGNP